MGLPPVVCPHGLPASVYHDLPGQSSRDAPDAVVLRVASRAREPQGKPRSSPRRAPNLRRAAGSNGVLCNELSVAAGRATSAHRQRHGVAAGKTGAPATRSAGGIPQCGAMQARLRSMACGDGVGRRITALAVPPYLISWRPMRRVAPHDGCHATLSAGVARCAARAKEIVCDAGARTITQSRALDRLPAAPLGSSRSAAPPLLPLEAACRHPRTWTT